MKYLVIMLFGLTGCSSASKLDNCSWFKDEVRKVVVYVCDGDSVRSKHE